MSKLTLEKNEMFSGDKIYLIR